MLSLLLTTCVVGFLTNIVSTEDRVSLAVYYESLCPDSDNFFHSQLAPTYQKLSDYLDVDIIPYGNAHYSGQPGEYRFSCQHGPEECYGNMVQACYITLVNNTAEEIKFINCAFDTRYQRKVLEKCIDNVDLRRQVKKCVTSPLGNNIMYEMAKKTDALVPKHTFIPWITINEKGGQDLNDKANQNLMNVICEEFSGTKPQECVRNKWNFLKQFRDNYL